MQYYYYKNLIFYRLLPPPHHPPHPCENHHQNDDQLLCPLLELYDDLGGTECIAEDEIISFIICIEFKFQYMDEFICISSKSGSNFFNNSVSNQNTTAYGSILSKYRGSCFRNNLNLFSSHAAKNSLYHSICDINLAHSSVSFIFLMFRNIIQKNPRHRKAKNKIAPAVG